MLFESKDENDNSQHKVRNSKKNTTVEDFWRELMNDSSNDSNNLVLISQMVLCIIPTNVKQEFLNLDSEWFTILLSIENITHIKSNDSFLSCRVFDAVKFILSNICTL